MKPTISTSLMAGGMLCLFLSLASCASMHQISNAGNDQPASTLTRKEPGGYKNDLNMKVVRKFTANFPGVSNVSWTRIKEFFLARFEKDSVQVMASYTGDGSCNYILKRYAENKMTHQIRHIVKSRFYDHSIIEVTEIWLPQFNNTVVYRVLLRNGGNFKIVEISNGETELLRGYHEK